MSRKYEFMNSINNSYYNKFMKKNVYQLRKKTLYFLELLEV
jgi:hypothetical protein